MLAVVLHYQHQRAAQRIVSDEKMEEEHARADEASLLFLLQLIGQMKHQYSNWE